MSRSLKVVLVLAAGFAFTVLTCVLAPGVLGVFLLPGALLTVAILAALRIHSLLAHGQVLWGLTIAFNTLIYSALIGLVLRLVKVFLVWRESQN